MVLAIFASLLVIGFKPRNQSDSSYIQLVYSFHSHFPNGDGQALWKSGHLKPGEELEERGSKLHFDKGWITKMVINGFGAFFVPLW